MANNVDNIIEVFYDQNDQNAVDFLTRLYECKDKDLSISTLYESSEDNRSWWEENIGAKWAYINDVDQPPEDGFFYINITSAWSQISEFVNHISKSLNDKCKITHQYIDEFPNFAGCCIIDNGSVTYSKEDPDMIETIYDEANKRQAKERLTFGSEEAREDWIWDWKWDFIHDFVDPDKATES